MIVQFLPSLVVTCYVVEIPEETVLFSFSFLFNLLKEKGSGSGGEGRGDKKHVEGGGICSWDVM